jgi:hypothetical protein
VRRVGLTPRTDRFSRRVFALAEQIATNPLVRSQPDQTAPVAPLATLVQTTQTQSGVTSVTIADVHGKVLRSTNPTLVNTELPLGDPGVAAERRIEPLISDRTSLRRLDPPDSADVATVVGNLVDNALDAAPGRRPRLRHPGHQRSPRGRCRTRGGEHGVVNHLLNRVLATARGPAAPLPKGLSNETADMVERALRGADSMSAGECASKFGISRVTTRRYLEHFCNTGNVDVSLRYGTAGRPERAVPLERLTMNHHC